MRRALLEAADLAERHCARAEAVRLLRAGGPRLLPLARLTQPVTSASPVLAVVRRCEAMSVVWKRFGCFGSVWVCAECFGTVYGVLILFGVFFSAPGASPRFLSHSFRLSPALRVRGR